jgi:hypothetical protein
MSNLKVDDNGQWELDGLEKMSYTHHSGPMSNTTYFNYVTSKKPINEEAIASTTKVKSKNGETLYHHTLIDKKTLDHINKGNTPERYDVHHILSKHKDFGALKKEGGIAAGMADVRKSSSVPTAEGTYTGSNLAILLGIGVADKAQGQGHGEHLLHNMIHHHGTLVGDYQYSDIGKKLVDKVSQHSAYNYVPDTDQSFGEATEKAATRCVFSLKDPSKKGKIPESSIAIPSKNVSSKAVKTKNISKR